jgi:alkaline phosphatase D
MDRRHFLRYSVAGLSLPALVACGTDTTNTVNNPTESSNTSILSLANAAELIDTSNPFPFGVASGDPTSKSVILWSAVVPKNSSIDAIPLQLEYVISPNLIDDEAQWVSLFTVASTQSLGTFVAMRSRDFTIKVDLGNEDLYKAVQFNQGKISALPANQFVYFRFVAGKFKSRIGRSKTLPTGTVNSCKYAVTSCSNLPAGYFSTYEMIRKEQLDFVVHLGDYLYEYGSGQYGDGEALTRKGVARVPNPPKEMVSQQDYVLRHQQYKMDADLQALHGSHPMITVWDDHEITNDSYKDGAENHNEGEGDYQERKARAIRAYFNWMPLGEKFPRQAITMEPDPREVIYRDFRVGDLMDLIMLDTRIVGRDKQASTPAVDPARFDENRNLIGFEQRKWLSSRLYDSKANKTIWTVLGQQVMFGQLNLVEVPQVKVLGQSLLGNLVALNMDQWDGYVAERNRVFNLIKDIGIENFVVLTGDIHTSWAIELYENPLALLGGTGQRSLGVELVTPSVTSPGFPDEVADAVSAAIPVANPHIKYNELKTKGFVLVEMTREKMTATWKYAQSITDEKLIGVENQSMRKRLVVSVGTNKFVEA